MMMENLLAPKKMKKLMKDQLNLSHRGKLAPLTDDQIGGRKLGPRSSTPPERESGGGRSYYSILILLPDR